MAFTDNKPASADDINTAIDVYTKDNFTAIKAAITQEHGWSDSSATACVHDQGTARIFVLPTASAPTPALAGRIWYDTTTGRFYRDTGSSWVDIDLSSTYLLLAGGTMTSEIAMGTNKITGLGVPVDGTDAATKSYADSIIGAGGAHATSHVDGTDDIQTATAAVKGLLLAADYTKLANAYLSSSQKDIIWAVNHTMSTTLVDGADSGVQPGIAFANAGTPSVYFYSMVVPYGYTSAGFRFRYRKSAATSGNAVFGWYIVVNGTYITDDSATISMVADTSEHAYTATTIGASGLSGGDVIGGYIYRDPVAGGDNYAGSIYVTHAYMRFA